jgi:hypothetical protein
MQPHEPFHTSLVLVATLTGCGVVGGNPSPSTPVPDHPALAVPDGESHRGGPWVGADIDDPRVLDELSRRYRTEKDFERDQEYFLRLLDYYLFSRDRLTGKTRVEIERIFGPPMDPDEEDSNRCEWKGGRDYLVVDFKDGIAVGAFHIMGY